MKSVHMKKTIPRSTTNRFGSLDRFMKFSFTYSMLAEPIFSQTFSSITGTQTFSSITGTGII